jgi:hypothetical protein
MRTANKRSIDKDKKEQLVGQTLRYKDKKGIHQGTLYGARKDFPWVVNGLEKFEVTWDLAQMSIETGLVINI